MEAAFFDLDKTVIARPSVVAFGPSLLREGFISRRTMLRALWGQLIYLHLGADEQRMERMRRSVLAVARGWDAADVRRLIREALDEVIEPIVFDEALDLIARHRAEGRAVFLVSTAPEEIVEPLADYLGVDDVIASRARLDRAGRYSGELESYAYGPEKARLMRRVAEARGIDLTRSWAYSDSATDLPMLEAVGNPVVVNPDRALLRAARANQWPVRVFVQPVRLRRRREPRVSLSTLGAGVAAVATGAGVAWWWTSRRRPDGATRLAVRLLAAPLGAAGRGAAAKPGPAGRASGAAANRGRARTADLRRAWAAAPPPPAVSAGSRRVPGAARRRPDAKRPDRMAPHTTLRARSGREVFAGSRPRAAATTGAQAERTFLTIKKASAPATTRRSSFFMGARLTDGVTPVSPGRTTGAARPGTPRRR